MIAGIFMLTPVQGFVAGSVGTHAMHRTVAVSMSLSPMDRRAALSTGASALLTLGAQAAYALNPLDSLNADKAEESTEAAALGAADEALKKADAKELSDEIALKKAQDAVMDAMQKGDKAKVAELQAKVRELVESEKADEAAKIKLAEEVRKDSALLRATKDKLKKDEAAEADVETKEMLKEEEAELKKVIGDDTSSVVTKFFKQ